MTPTNPAAILGALGGKARAAKLTPEQRSAIARKAGLARAEGLTQAQRSKLGRKAAKARWRPKKEPPAPVESPKTERPLPKPGTMNALVLGSLKRWPDKPISSAFIVEDIVMCDRKTPDISEIRNALSSLRTAGHVISVPHPTSRRERLWRLA